MADQKFTTGNQAGSGSSHGFEKDAEKPTTASKNVTDQAFSAGREIKDKASGLVDAASTTVQDKASEFVDTARDVGSPGNRQAETGGGRWPEERGCVTTSQVTSQVRSAAQLARSSDGDLPIAGTYIRKAAAQVEGVADTIRTRQL